MIQQKYEVQSNISDEIRNDFVGIDFKAIDFWKRNAVFLTNLKRLKSLKQRGFMAFDVETRDGLKGKVMYCWSLAFRTKGGLFDSIVKEVENNFDLDELFEKIDNTKDKNHKRIIFVHNLGFDVRFLINYCVKKHIQYKVLLSGSQIINFTIDEIGVIFRDSAQYLQSSQEKAEIEYEIDEKYRKIDCKDLFEKEYELWSREDKNRVLEHNKNDVIALLNIMIKYRKIMYEIGGMDMLTTYSLASLTMKIFRTTIDEFNPIQNPFIFLKWNENKGKPSYQFDKDREKFVRESYFGGRNEVYDMNLHENAKYVDKVSMYPSEMFYNYFPVGIPFWVNCNHHMLKKNKEKLLEILIEKPKLIRKVLKNDDNKDLTKYFNCKFENGQYYVYRDKYKYEGFMKARIIPSKLKYPILPHKLDNKLMFTNCLRVGVYSLPELRYAKSLGYEIEPIRGLLFSESDDIFTDFIKPLFILKSENKGGKRKSAKIGMNSSYGKFGQKFERTAPIMHYFQSNEEMFEFIAEHSEIKKYKAISNDETKLNVLYEIVENTTIKSFMNVCLASYITSYSRIALHKILNFLGNLNIKIFYTDSDSITIEEKALEYITLSKQLGAWDIEETFEKVKFLAPKAYIGISKGKPFLKMKGVDRLKIDEIKETSNTIEEIEEKLRKPIQLAERYMTYREAHRYGLILGTKIRCKHYSFENWKRDFKNGVSEAWNDETIPLKLKKEILTEL